MLMALTIACVGYMLLEMIVVDEVIEPVNFFREFMMFVGIQVIVYFCLYNTDQGNRGLPLKLLSKSKST